MFRFAVASVALFMGTQAYGQGQQCYPRDVVLENLQGQFGESVQSLGIAANGTILEMFANVETGTWTAVVTAPDGSVSCLVASGEAFERVDSDAHPTGARL